MKLQNIFYIVGVLFIISTVLYFVREFIRELPPQIKLILLVTSLVISFIVAELLRGGDY